MKEKVLYKTGSIMRRIAAGLLFVLLLLSFFPFVFAETAGGQSGKVIRVAFPIVSGLSEIDSQGNHTGLVVDYLNEIAKYTGWKYQYIEIGPENTSKAFLEGKVDITGGIYYNQVAEAYFSYPNYSMGTSRGVLLCRKDDTSLKSYDLNSLNGKTIGVYAPAVTKIHYLNEFLAKNDIQCTLKYYSAQDLQNGNLYTFLENREIDMLLGNDLESHGDFRVVTSFEAQPYYIVTAAGNEEMKSALNMALSNIFESNPNFAAERYNANFSDIHLHDLQFNEAECGYIASKKTLSVAVVNGWHPFYCLDNDEDNHNGLLPDLLNKISELTGMQFTYVCADSYFEAIQLVQEGKADILGSFLDGDTASDMNLICSRSYVSMNNIVVKNKAVNYPSEELTGSIVKGRSIPNGIAYSQMRDFSNLKEAVTAVNRGEVDFVYGTAACLEAEIQKNHLTNVVPVTLVNNRGEVAFAVTQPVSPELLTILNKAIGSIPAKERETMLAKNLVSIGYSSFTLTDMIYANPIAFIAALAAFVLLVIAVVLIIARAKVKNVLMQNELKRAEAESKAKGEFLSRMSHEIRTPMNAIVGMAELTCMLPDVPKPIEEKLQQIRASSQYLLYLINDILDMSRIDSKKMDIDVEAFSLVDMLGGLQDMMQVQAQQRQVSFNFYYTITHDVVVGDSIRLKQVLINLLSNGFKFTQPGGFVSLQVTEEESNGKTAAYTFSIKDNGVGISQQDQKRIFHAFVQIGPNTSKSEGTGLGLAISSNLVHLMGGDLRLNSKIGEGSEFFFTLRLPVGGTLPLQNTRQTKLKSLKGVRILLAEDNELNAEIASELLRIKGIWVERAANGQQAVEMFLTHESGYYQLILMDIQMPEKNGLEATREIRASCYPNAKAIPIIAMTANSFKEDERQAIDAGMNGFIAKPVDANYLYKVIEENL